jgi:hypothetical protein
VRNFGTDGVIVIGIVEIQIVHLELVVIPIHVHGIAILGTRTVFLRKVIRCTGK